MIFSWHSWSTEILHSQVIPYSPAHMLMSRSLRTKVPAATNQIKPAVVEPRLHLTEQKRRQKWYYDRSARSLPPLKPGDTVHVRRHNSWEPGIVTSIDRNPRSYWVDHGYAHNIRRNRQHLLKTGEALPTFPIEEPDLNIPDTHTPNDQPAPSNLTTIHVTYLQSRSRRHHVLQLQQIVLLRVQHTQAVQ